MSEIEKVGKLNESYYDAIQVEWEINNFYLEMLKTFKYDSPIFTFSKNTWMLRLECFCEYIFLYTLNVGGTELRTITCELGFKKVDGGVEYFPSSSPLDVFINPQYFKSVCLLKEELKEQMQTLVSGYSLTISCTIRRNFTNSGTQSASTSCELGHMKLIAGCASVDEFTQTEKGTGILKLQQDFKEIWGNGNVSDVVLKVEGQEFKSHRCVLAARSPVFLAMMTHELKEKNTGVVDIPDVDANTFLEFLKYLYTGSEEIITSENVVKLYTVADKYQVDELKKSCFDYMLNNISVDNFCDILSLSLEHVEKDLTDACSQFFMENSLAIVLTPKWLRFLDKNPVAGNELYIKHLKNIMKNQN